LPERSCNKRECHEEAGMKKIIAMVTIFLLLFAVTVLFAGGQVGNDKSRRGCLGTS
jgi:hypothetical protein